MKLLLILIILSSISFAQDLYNAKIISFCNGSLLNIQLYSGDGRNSTNLELNLSSSCEKELKTLKTGNFYDFEVNAVCVEKNLFIITTIATDAQILIDKIIFGLSSECQEAKKKYY